MKPPLTHCVLFLLCASCATTGPISEPIVGVGAALLAALDQLLASGVLSPEQYAPIAAGVRGVSQAVAEVATTAQQIKHEVDAAKAAQWSPEAITGLVGGAATVVAGAATAINNRIRDSHYTPEQLLERKVARLKARAAA
jgi:hypothetical protein